MLRRILLGLIVVLVIIQFIRPSRNISPEPPGPNDFATLYTPPAGVRTVLEHACYDCHSNNTRYPWYANVQPIGWWLANHVNEGKRELNFSEFGTYTLKRKSRKLDAISDQVSNREMPLKSYTWIHADARLTDEQVNAVSAWMDALRDQVAPGE
jgi:hypothetical protein